MSSKSHSIAFRLNLTIFILTLLSSLWMLSGVFITAESTLSSASLTMFKYFTVDSNVFMGIIALISAVKLKKAAKLPNSYYILKLMGTTGVTLTMLVTCFFLAPTIDGPWWSLFTNSNFFLHLGLPVLAIITFVRFERTDQLPIKASFAGILPMVIYAAFYITNCLLHVENGMVPLKYDWYGFLFMGVKSVVVVIPVIVIVTCLISLGLWRWNKKGN